MSEHGRVLAVNRVRLGSELVGEHAAAETVLIVDDGSDFDEDGGWLSIGDQIVQYESADHNQDDTAELVLADPLDSAADDGDPVLLWDRSRDVQASEMYAEVELDGETGGDSIKALVAHHLVDELPEGIRGLVGESVILDEDGDDWRVIDVLGIKDAAGRKWEDNDPYVLTIDDVTAGSFTHTLAHDRIVSESMQVPWWSLVQPADSWVLDADEGVLTYTLSGNERVGDVFSTHYQYLNGPTRERGSFLLDWGSAGWRTLEVTAADSTNRAGTGFDDSGWAVETAPFGDDVGHPFDYIPGLDWPAPVTSIPKVSALWLRRTITGWTGALIVRVRVDNSAKVYWNGTLVGTTTATILGEYAFEIDAADVLETNTLAVRGEDVGPNNTYNHAYLDVKVESA